MASATICPRTGTFIATPVAWIALAFGICSLGSSRPGTDTEPLLLPLRTDSTSPGHRGRIDTLLVTAGSLCVRGADQSNSERRDQDQWSDRYRAGYRGNLDHG